MSCSKPGLNFDPPVNRCWSSRAMAGGAKLSAASLQQLQNRRSSLLHRLGVGRCENLAAAERGRSLFAITGTGEAFPLVVLGKVIPRANP